MTTKNKKKLPKMYNLQLYYKQGADLSGYLAHFEKEGVPTAILTWLEHLEKNIKSLKKLVKKLDKKKIKCLADTNEIAFISTDTKTLELLEASDLLLEDRITVDLAYNTFDGEGIDSKLDDKLRTLAQEYHGSNTDAGCGFIDDKNCQRDITFEFSFQNEADNFEKAAKKLIPKKQRVS
jgi:hypothetical protein